MSRYRVRTRLSNCPSSKGLQDWQGEGHNQHSLDTAPFVIFPHHSVSHKRHHSPLLVDFAKRQSPDSSSPDSVSRSIVQSCAAQSHDDILDPHRRASSRKFAAFGLEPVPATCRIIYSRCPTQVFAVRKRAFEEEAKSLTMVSDEEAEPLPRRLEPKAHLQTNDGSAHGKLL